MANAVAEAVVAQRSVMIEGSDEARQALARQHRATTADIQHVGLVIGEVSASVAAMREEQGAAIREIARSVGEAASGTGHVTETLHDLRREAGETAGQVLDAASTLARHSGGLTRGVGGFLAA